MAILKAKSLLQEFYQWWMKGIGGKVETRIHSSSVESFCGVTILRLGRSPTLIDDLKL